MSTFERALKAKDILRSAMGRPKWLRGVGVGQDKRGYFIKVNVDAITSDLRDDVPREVDGVRVRLEEVGDITAG